MYPQSELSEKSELILFHVYRSQDRKPDAEGYLGPLSLAVMLKYQMILAIENNVPWVPPYILFGADLNEISDGVPLHEIYRESFIEEATNLGLSERDYRSINPKIFGKAPVGTKTELEALSYAAQMLGIKSTPLSFCREGHTQRINHLANKLGMQINVATHEGVFRSLILSGKETELDIFFPDRHLLRYAERSKMMFINLFDHEGSFMEWLSSYSPRFKNLLLDVAGHNRSFRSFHSNRANQNLKHESNQE